MAKKSPLDIDNYKHILQQTIKLAGSRYSDDLHIPIAAPVDKIKVVVHDESYRESIVALYRDITQLVNKPVIKDIAKDELAVILHEMSGFIDNYPLDVFDWCSCKKKMAYVQDKCYEILKQLDGASQQDDVLFKKTSIRDLTILLNHVDDLISEENQRLYNSRLAILYGEGGMGKTHLLCDYTKRRLESELPTIFFLSDSLAGTDPTLAIAKKLGLKSKKSFLKELEQITKQCGQVCIVIDAINENPGIRWKKITEILTVPSVSIILSVRSGFEMAAGVNEWNVPRIAHQGFAEGDLEWDAMQKYFQHYGLTDVADTPVLYEEFRNPLFLKIFCESYSGSKTNKKPRGNMMTNVFEQYVAKKTSTVSSDLGIGIGRKDIWDNVIKEIATVLGHKGVRPTISYRKLRQIIKSANIACLPKRIIDVLCNNGILRKIPHYTKSYKRLGYDYEFVYHKFSDHVIVRYFLNSFNQLQESDAIARLSKSSFLRNALKEWNTGLLEALAIQYPERYRGHELIEIIPYKHKFSRAVWTAILDSIVWRNPKTFTIRAKEVLKQYIMNCNHKEGILLDYLNRLVAVATTPEHPFNARELHSILSRNIMPRRDVWWQEYTCYSGNDGGAFARLCSWAFSGFGVAAPDDQKFLATLTLAWFTASSNKDVRDRASYAILNLVGDNLKIIYRLLHELKDCDDQYILERLYLISYGVIIRAHGDKKSFKRIVYFIDKVVFNNRDQMPNIIVNQCAKDIVELYQSRYDDIDSRVITRAMPPYDYRNPFKRLPSVKTIINKYGEEASKNNCRTIIGSVMYPYALADFGNYTMGGCFRNLSGVPISELIPMIVQQYNSFLSSLTQAQEEALWEYRSALRNSMPTRIPAIRILGDKQDDTALKHTVYPAITTKADVSLAKKTFANMLSELQRKQLEAVSDYIFSNKNPNLRYHDRRYDLLWARRWVFKNVLRLGWSYSLHGEFDVARYRHDHVRGSSDIARVERIGKKYQWISLHQLMALASSQYYLLDNYGSYQLSQYVDSLSFNDRRFDPTIPPDWVIDNSGQLFSNNETPCERDEYSSWWQPHYKILDDDPWLFSTHDIPTIDQLVFIQHDNTEYLALQNWPTWKKHYDDRTKWRELWIQVNSYIVKLDDISKIDQLCQSSTFSPMEWELPNSELHDEFFLGEILHNTPLFSTDFESMSKLISPSKKRTFSVATTTLEYDGRLFELGSVMRKRIQMPSPFLRKQLGLTVNKHMSFTNGNGVESFCPAIDSPSNANQYILVANKGIIDYLHECGYTIMWTVIGEKQEFNDLPPNRDSICLRGCMYIDERKRAIKKVRFNKISDEYKT